MIVCLCRALAEHAIRSAIAEGAFTVEDVGAVCRAGTAGGAGPPTLGGANYLAQQIVEED